MTKDAASKNGRGKGQATSAKETQKQDANVTITLIIQTAGIVIAVIGCLSAVTVALLDSPVVSQLLPPTSTIPPTLTPPVDTPPDTAVPSATHTFMPSAEPTSTPYIIPTLTATLTPSDTPVPPRMVVIPWANKYGGPVPLKVQFSVRGSYVELADGTRSYCAPSTCSYTWSVLFTTMNQIVSTPKPWQETFAFTFNKKGLYHIEATVCQGDICGSARIQVEGR
ncbi:MAG: hypothetical protein HY869_15845 [Chloroflexi bacterium]|nr:hypothetical protein [Chloroflexota bacterium]